VQYQEKRGIVYLVSNLLVSTFYVLYIAITYQAALALHPDDRVFWAAAILIFIPVQVFVRLLVIIVFAIVHKIVANEESVEVEDELDKLIDLKATRIFYGVFMFGLMLTLLGQALGMPLWALFGGISASIVVSGLTGDLVQFIFYRRGV
jgi:hypothetical protein